MRLKLALSLPLLAVCSAAQAQTEQQFRQCNGADPALAIIGCTAVIDARDSNSKLKSGALANRGLAYMKRNQMDRAIADFERAVMLDDKNAIALLGRGQLLSSAGRPDARHCRFRSRGCRQPQERRRADAARQLVPRRGRV
jgi:Tfp pilus assembly protein PilF